MNWNLLEAIEIAVIIVLEVVALVLQIKGKH